MATISEALALALQHHQAGRLDVAEQIYRQILAVEPNQPDAIHLLGVIAYQVGQPAVAVEYIQRAIALNGSEGVFHCNLGNALLAQGKLDEAMACFRRALELKPDYAEALYNLGNAFEAQGKLDEAVASFRRALELKPDYAQAHNNLGNALRGQGKLGEAAACFRRALELEPDLAEALFNLGNALQAQRELEEAIACYRRALELKPDYAQAHNNLGNALLAQGKLDEAAANFRRALELKPDYAEALYNLGNAFQEQGKLDEAVANYRRALELKPDYADAHINLGNAFRSQGKLDEAAACFHRALELKPEHAEAHVKLGNVFLSQGKLEEAVTCYRRALELRPDFAAAYNNLGNAFQAQGRLDETVACYRRALELKPDFVAAHSNLLFTLYFCPGYDAKTIYEEHRRWNQQHAEPLAKLIQPHANERSADRRLRIGYVSPDFRECTTGFFLLPLLEAHDHERFEIFCYASVHAPDAITDRCIAQADVWRNVRGIADEQLAHTIRQDRIDILVDLTMHTVDNRLLVFARKPAPVQVTYLACAGTTGLSAMDYRLTDPFLDPPGQDERIYSEESIHLPESFWCYRQLSQTPAVNPLPALQAGHITFGCLNRFAKVTEPTLTAWIGLLKAMPAATLLHHAPAGKHRDRVREFFARHGILPERLTFADWVPLAEYFQLYHRIDVGLDSFPYGGGTTTCDALWMGVPVVSLAGQTAVGRGGKSILSNLGLANLVAYDSEQYVQIARELASDLPRLSMLRATLRERMQNSPLMDAPRFTRHVEAAYRAMWQRWCDR